MLAKFKGRCGVCGLPFPVGEEITWSRQPKTVLPFGGKVYHKACSKRLAELEPEPAPAPVSVALPTAPDAAVLAELIRKLMSTPPATGAVGQEPEESDYAPVPDTAPAPAPKPKLTPKSRLTNSSPWYEVFSAVLPLVNRILLIGPPSSGKTTTTRKIADAQYRVTMTETTSREDLIGMFHLIDGETKFVPVNFTLAMREGKAVLLEEVDRYSPESASLMYSLIDDKPYVSLPNGEVVEAKDGYRVIMTTNETLETLPAAVQDRIECIIMASTPHCDAVADLSKGMRTVVQRYYESQPIPSLKLAPTVRRMRAFHKLITNGIPNEVAANLVFGTGGAKEVLSAITSAEGK